MVRQLYEWAADASLSDERVREILTERLADVGSPFRLFTDEEMLDILDAERADDTGTLASIYEAAAERFDQVYPGVRARGREEWP